MRRTLIALLAIALMSAIGACATPTAPESPHDWCVWHGTGPDACR